MQTFKAKVAEHSLLAGSFQYLHLELVDPRHIEFLAGQYVILTIDASRGIRRDYSIASPPSMDHAIELLIDVKPGGEGSKHLINLTAGDEVEFTGPVGNFVVDEGAMRDARGSKSNNKLSATSHELLFVATGSGISPTRSMILDQLVTKHDQRSMRLWWGMRYQEDCFWTQEFDQLEREHPNFQWDLVLSRPPEDWPLHSGHVTGHALDYVKKRILNTEYRIPNTMSHDTKLSHSEFPARIPPRREGVAGGSIQNSVFCFYLCGSQEMIQEVSTALEKAGISKDHIHHEQFF